MKHTKNLFILSTTVTSLLFCILMSSCKQPFMKDPRLYNKKPDAIQNGGAGGGGSTPGGIDDNIVIPDGIFGDDEEEEETLDGGVTIVKPFDQTDEWFNNPSCNGDATSPTKLGFDAGEFDTIAIRGEFDNSNVPTYTMTKSNVWGAPTNTTTNEYIHRGAPDTVGQGYGIKNVSYYQYRGKNPCYPGVYNDGLQTSRKGNPQLSRFYFYRFTGKGGGVQPLDNFLIAIDTYSKFIFAFAKPTSTTTVFGQQVPTAWGATDFSSTDGKFLPVKTDAKGHPLYFYDYDPVGYIVKNPDNSYTAELYKWFKDNLASGNFEGSINTGFTEVAKKTPDGAGKTPFQEKRIQQQTFLKTVQGKSFSYREDIGINSNFANDGNGYGENLFTYTFSADGITVTLTKTPWGGTPEVVATGTTADSPDTVNNVKYKFDNSQTLSFRVDKLGKIVTVDNQKYYNTKYFIDKGPTFQTLVRGRNFSYRDEDGLGLNKITYTFSSDGKTVTVTTTPWLQNQSSETYNVEEIEGSPLNGKIFINGQEISLEVDGSRLLINGTPSFTDNDFKDLGPGFLNRVKGKVFEGSGYKYTFSEDGKTIKCEGGTGGTYTFIEAKTHTHGKYKKGLTDYGITISKNDSVIKWSGGFGGNANDEGTDDPAYVKTDDYKGALLTFDTLVFYDRPAESGYTHGENLYKYTFSDLGRTLTKTSENYTTKKCETIETYTFAEEISGSKNKGYFKDSAGSQIELDLSPDKKTIKLGGNQYFDSDPGPDFLIRVKGKTFEGCGYTYSFTPDGKTINITGKSNKTYTYSKQKGQTAAVYKERFLTFWGVAISNEDKTIKWTGSSYGGPETTNTELATEWAANLVE